MYTAVHWQVGLHSGFSWPLVFAGNPTDSRSRIACSLGKGFDGILWGSPTGLDKKYLSAKAEYSGLKQYNLV